MDISFIEEMLGNIDSHQRTSTQVASGCGSSSTRFNLTWMTRLPVASRYLQAGSHSKIGFISPMSDNFCASCNRVRLTAEGRLLLCLGNEHSRDRAGYCAAIPVTGIAENAISEALLNKPSGTISTRSRYIVAENMTGTIPCRIPTLPVIPVPHSYWLLAAIALMAVLYSQLAMAVPPVTWRLWRSGDWRRRRCPAALR